MLEREREREREAPSDSLCGDGEKRRMDMDGSKQEQKCYLLEGIIWFDNAKYCITFPS